MDDAIVTSLEYWDAVEMISAVLYKGFINGVKSSVNVKRLFARDS